MGVTLALPLLDSMIPAGTALVKTAAQPKSRFCGIYIPHGATMDKWTPATEGGGFAFTESSSRSKNSATASSSVSNLAHPMAGGKGSDAGADHARSAAVFLSGAHPDKGTVHAGKTVDQLLADHIGQDTPLPSIEVCIEEVALNCGAGYGCAYYNTISWRNDSAAAADGEQPASGIRTPVRRWHQRGAAAVAQAAGQEHPRRGDAEGGTAAGRTRRRRSRRV